MTAVKDNLEDTCS